MLTILFSNPAVTRDLRERFQDLQPNVSVALGDLEVFRSPMVNSRTLKIIVANEETEIVAAISNGAKIILPRPPSLSMMRAIFTLFRLNTYNKEGEVYFGNAQIKKDGVFVDGKRVAVSEGQRRILKELLEAAVSEAWFVPKENLCDVGAYRLTSLKVVMHSLRLLLTNAGFSHKIANVSNEGYRLVPQRNSA